MEIEKELLDCIARGTRPFHEVVDAFVGQLLGESMISDRWSDGVLFEWESIEHNRASGAGVVVLIDGQIVQPLRVEFELDPTTGCMVAGFVYFGNTDLPNVAYGSQAHRKLSMQILADPTVDFAWIERFFRDALGWHREARDSDRDPMRASD